MAPTARHPATIRPTYAAARSRPRSRPATAGAAIRRWNLLLANTAIEVFLAGVDASLLRPPVNMMRLGMHPGGFAPRLRNLGPVRAHLLPRLARQVANTGDAALSALYEELLSYGSEGEPAPPDPADIALPMHVSRRL